MAELEKKGIILIDKPREMTSFGVVSRLRRLVGVKKIGHTGTLDPFAEGLLAVCVGKATSVVQFMDTFDKTYQVRVVFGSATDTMDLTGSVIAHHDFVPGELENMRSLDYAPLRQAVSELVGPSEQMPPMYSAVKIDGQPLYALARKGQTIERTPRPIIVYQATIDAVDCRTETEPAGPFLAVDLTIAVSKGTYIRVIADELGRRLGYFGHAQRLVRTQVGPFALSQALQLDWLSDRFDELASGLPGPGGPDMNLQDRRYVQDRLWQLLIEQDLVHELGEALVQFPVLTLDDRQARQVIQGQKLFLTAEQVFTRLTPGAVPFDLQSADLASMRLTLHNTAGLIGVGHFLVDHDMAALTYRLVTERIFLNHECLLPE
ncbi:MAG: truB [Firmicutes bacterium]|nr:truB [Bacillota bacterium]